MSSYRRQALAFVMLMTLALGCELEHDVLAKRTPKKKMNLRMEGIVKSPPSHKLYPSSGLYVAFWFVVTLLLSTLSRFCGPPLPYTHCKVRAVNILPSCSSLTQCNAE